MDDELNLEELDNVTAGYQDRKSDILMELKRLKDDLKNPLNNEQDRQVIYGKMAELEEILNSLENSKSR